MRPIDADELINELQIAMDGSVKKYGNIAKRTPILKTTKLIINLIKAMPTAYDIDKVCKQIKEHYGCHNCEQADTMACNECAELEVINEICEIVKRGGI